MPTATRTFRVFVSSTFEDLKAERDALQRDVFPKLRRLCEENGARFQAIDLRWGVRDEAALDQRTMRICLEEIARCQRVTPRPNFIVLLGDRYGWRPVPSAIPADEFEAIEHHLAPAEKELLQRWYKRDDNAVPPIYDLQPREGDFIDRDRWGAEERRLREVLLRATADLPENRRFEYRASATEREIVRGAMEVADAQEHVFSFFRTIADVPHDTSARDFIDLDERRELDAVGHAQLIKLKERLRSLLPGNTHSYEAEWTSTGPTTAHIGSLPETLEECLTLNQQADAPSTLCVDVWRRLSRVILHQIARIAAVDPLDKEIEAHEAFARNRARHFTGRKSVLDTIDAHIRGGESRPLVVHGPSGSGKSAIVAKAAAQAKAEMPGAVLIQRFIGVTPDASSGITLLRSLCEQLSREYGVTEETPMGFQPLVVAFHERIVRATPERPFVLFLDALDQLRSDDEACSFAWLRQNLPPHVSLVVSTTEIPAGLESAVQVAVEDFPVREAEEVLAAWLQESHRQLQPEQREKVLSGFAPPGLPLYLKLAFEEARRWRSFQAAERCVLGNDVGGMIDVLFDRLSEEPNHGPTIVNRSLGFLAAARYGLTEDEMLDVLAADDEVWEDFESRAHHTPPTRRLPVIVWSRLFLDLEPYLNERAVPGGNVMAFYHRQVAERAASLYLQKDEGTLRHAALAKFFGNQPNWRNQVAMQANERKITELVRQQIGANALADLETTLTGMDLIAAKCAAGLVVDLELDYRDAITALPEAQAELREEARRQSETARWTEDIIDYARQWNARRDRLARGETIEEPEPKLPQPVRSSEPWSKERIEQDAERIRLNPARIDRLQALQGFVRQETYPLQEFGTRSGFAVQHLFNHAPRGSVHKAATQALPAVEAPLLLRHWFARDQYNPRIALVRTLEGHTLMVASVSVTPDGRRAVSASDDHTVRLWDLETGVCLRVLEVTGTSLSVTPDGQRAVSAGYDTTMRVWDLETGTCLQVLEGHTAPVASVSVTPDGQRAVSGGGRYDRTVRVWDLESGQCLRTLEGHRDLVESVSVTPDCRRAVSASGGVDSRDHTVRVWDLEEGACLRVLEGHTGSVRSVSVTPDCRRAVSASDDHTVRVWDLETGSCSRVLEGHTAPVASVSVTPDGRRAVSGSWDKTVRVWDLESGMCLRVLEGHTDRVDSASMTPDCRRAVSASYDHTVRVWDLERGASLCMLEGRTAKVESVSMTPDSQRAVSGGWDRTVRVWDLETGLCLRVLEGHTGFVRSVSVTPDGRRAVSASNDKTVRVWDLETMSCLRVLEGHSAVVNGVSVTADGRCAVSASGDDPFSWISLSSDSNLRLWDLDTGICLRVLEGHSNVVESVSVTPDGRRAVSGSWDDTLRLWDLETGACLRTLEGHRDSVKSVGVTSDGRRAVSGSNDQTVRVWDLETGACLRVLEGHTERVTSVNVTPDGRHTVSGSDDQTVRVWDLETGTCLAVARLPVPITAVALSSSLSRMIVGTSNGEVLHFDSHGLT